MMSIAILSPVRLARMSAEISRLRAEIARLQAENAELRAEVQKLYDNWARVVRDDAP